MIDHVLITGGAGFIGSHLADRLLARGHRVTVYDNLSTGFVEFLEDARRQPGFTLIEGDLLDEARLAKALSGCDLVFHLAANADVRFGTAQPRRDLEQNTIATFNLLEAMRANGVRRIAFASTGSIYGETSVIPTPEDAPFPVQTSLYGASKLAGEGLIAAYCEGFEFQSWIFRFVSIVGERYTHGHVFDFYKSLARDPTTLHVLGNGRQTKSYLYVAGLRRSDAGGGRAGERQGQRLQPRHRGVCPSRGLDRDHHGASRPLSAPHLRRRRARLDRRQPLHLSRYDEDSRARLGAPGRHPSRHYSHGRLAQGQSLDLPAANMIGPP